VKDRAALYVVQDAEKKGLIWYFHQIVKNNHFCFSLGLLKPGGVVVEGTAGNTGIGLAHICRAKGYKCVIYMPNTQSQEKIDLLRILGSNFFSLLFLFLFFFKKKFISFFH